MQHSLVSRFQGAFLGAALGNILGTNCRRSIASLPWQAVEQWGFADVLPARFTVGQLMVEQARQIIRAPHSLHPLHAQVNDLFDYLMAVLPLLLFYHDDPQQITVLLSSVQAAPERIIPEILTLNHVLTAVLQERLNQPYLDRLIPTLIQDLDLDQTAPQLAIELQHTQTCLIQALPITDATFSQLSPLPLALYAFLHTPTDLRLSLLRVSQIATHPELTCTIAGFLAGANVSSAGIPTGWRRILDHSTAEASPLFHLWGLSNTSALLNLADQLWAAWSGAFQPEQWLQNPISTTVTAAPHLIRPR